jgi:hypothetical protein
MERRSVYNAPVAIAPIIVFHNNEKFSTGLWKSQTVSGVVWYKVVIFTGDFVSFCSFAAALSTLKCVTVT